MKYIAYGRNLDEDLMKLRCPEAEIIEKGTLKGYSLSFRGINNKSYLTLCKNKYSSIPIVIYNITKNDLKLLDECEKYPNLYDRKKIKYQTENGNKQKALTYFMSNYYQLAIPNEDYLSGVLQAYIDQGFDIKYIEQALNKSLIAYGTIEYKQKCLILKEILKKYKEKSKVLKRKNLK